MSVNNNNEDNIPTPIMSNRNHIAISSIPSLELPKSRFSSLEEEPISMSPESFAKLHHPNHRRSSSVLKRRSSTVAVALALPSVELDRNLQSVAIELAIKSTLQACGIARNRLRRSFLLHHHHTTPTTLYKERSSSILQYAATAAPTTNIRGIPNYGQTCFLNSALQALASLEPVLAYLERIVVAQQHNDCFANQVLSILKLVNGQNNTTTRIDPRVLLKKVGEQHAQFQESVEQQDAQELLQAVLGMIIDQLDFSVLATSNNTEDTNETLASVLWKGRNSKVLPSIDEHEQCNGTSDETTKVNDEALNGEKHPVLNSNGVHHVSSGAINGIALNGEGPLMLETRREEKKQDEYEALLLPRVTSEEHYLDSVVPRLNGGAEPLSAMEALVQLPTKDGTTRTNSSASRSPVSVVPEPTNFVPEASCCKHKVTKAMEIAESANSPTTPSPLSGWVGSAILCATCHRVRPIQNTPFLDIPVVPTAVVLQHNSNSSSSPCRLEECLHDFTRVERVNDVECRNCTIQSLMEEIDGEKELLEQTLAGLVERRGASSADAAPDEFQHLRDEVSMMATKLQVLQSISPDEQGPLMLDEAIPLKRCGAFKCLLLTRLPAILSIHVQRRYYNLGTTSKTSQHVIFPEILDVSPYCAYNNVQTMQENQPFAGSGSKSQQLPTPIPYRLMAVIEHQGGPYSGHYVSYRRDGDRGWLWISDDTVQQCKWERVQRCQAYMLFYEAM